MSFKLVNITTGPAVAVVLNDLGITVPASTTLDITDISPQEIALSGAPTGDLGIAIAAGDIVIEDPRAGYSGNLSLANSLVAALAANDSHIGVQLASIADLTDVGGVPVPGEVLEFDNDSGQYLPVAASVIGGNIALGDLSDVDDLAAHTADAPVILMGDGTNFDTVPLIGGTSISGVAVSGTSYTFNIDDDFLKNTGDNLTTGTLTIDPGAAIVISGSGAGGTLTIQQDANATIATPTVGFTIDSQIVNKEYVDSVALGLDWKESVRVGTITSDIGGTYAAGGGTGGTGAFTLLDTTSANTAFDGITLAVGDRVLVKNQTDGKENGIYVVTVASATVGQMERAADQDGSPASEVSAGNATFIEEGTQADTGWVISTNDPIILNTTVIVWTQFSGTGAGANAFGAITGGDGGVATADAPSDGIQFNGTGINIIGVPGGTASVTFALDIPDLTNGAETLLISDTLAVYDGTATLEYPLSDVVADLEIPNAVGTGVGYVVSNGSGAYTTNVIAVDGTGNKEGLTIVGGNGSATTTIGLDIVGNTLAGEDVAAGDLFLLYNSSGTPANEAFTAQEVADGLFSLSSGISNAFASIAGGDGGTAVAIGTDTITISGTGINVVAANLGAGLDTITLALDIADLTAGAETLLVGDSIAVNDGTATLEYTFTDIVTDLQIPNAVGGGTGFLVSDGSGNYTTRTISASVDEDEDGLIVNTTDGTANLTVGLDIIGMTNPVEDMAATDEFAVHNKSEGTDGANHKMTGQEIADGVSTILNLTGLTVTTIGGQEVLTLVDTTRTNKVLSIETTAVTWSENRIGNNDWVQIGNANDALIGYIVPLNATIVKVTAHTTSASTTAKPIALYIDDVLNSTIATLPLDAGGLQTDYSSVTDNIDITAGQKIQLRGAATGGTIEDTVITIWLKWRG